MKYRIHEFRSYSLKKVKITVKVGLANVFPVKPVKTTAVWRFQGFPLNETIFQFLSLQQSGRALVIPRPVQRSLLYEPGLENFQDHFPGKHVVFKLCSWYRSYRNQKCGLCHAPHVSEVFSGPFTDPIPGALACTEF